MYFDLFTTMFIYYRCFNRFFGLWAAGQSGQHEPRSCSCDVRETFRVTRWIAPRGQGCGLQPWANNELLPLVQGEKFQVIDNVACTAKVEAVLEIHACPQTGFADDVIYLSGEATTIWLHMLHIWYIFTYIFKGDFLPANVGKYSSTTEPIWDTWLILIDAWNFLRCPGRTRALQVESLQHQARLLGSGDGCPTLLLVRVFILGGSSQ